MTVDPRQRELERMRALILWISFLATQILFVVLLLSGIVPAGRAPPQDLATVFTVLALAAGIVAHLTWRRARSHVVRVVRKVPDPAALLPHYIVAWALDESIAIFGLVLGVLGFPPAVWSGLSAVAFFLTLMHRPA